VIKQHAFFLKLILPLCLIFHLTSCSSTMSLRYEKPIMMEKNKGDIYVAIEDQRVPEKGGDEPLVVGAIRNSVGMPFPLNASPDREPSKVIKEMVSDCLNAAGYTVADNPDGVPHLSVVLEEFWSDGYQHSRIWTKIPAELKKDENSKPVWVYLFESNIGVTWKTGYGPFDQGINSMLDDVKYKMLTEFKDPGFHKSLNSLQ